MSATSGITPWLSKQTPNPDAAMRLFCFPYAGGFAGIFRGWSEALPSSVEVCAVQLPGRGSRWDERPFTDLALLIDTFAKELRPFWDKPFALFGHSMGAIISFELARYLYREYGIEPLHLFVSGSCAPNFPRHLLPSYDLSASGYLETLRRLNGIPTRVLEHEELMKLLLPVLRADFQMMRTYTYGDATSLACPITAFCGVSDEEVSTECISAWREQTAGRFSLKLIEGDHFFLQKSKPLLLKLLSEDLTELVGGGNNQ